MAETSTSRPITPNPDRCLRSWKEIAAYLECSVATAQRWERSEMLPVHRHVHGTAGSAYAYVSEIENWRKLRTVAAVAAAGVPDVPPDGSQSTQPRGGRQGGKSATTAASRLRSIRTAWPWAAGLVMLLAAVTLLVSQRFRAPSGAELIRLNIDVGMKLSNYTFGTSTLLSPDGTRMVFSGRGPDGVFRLYTRALNSSAAQLLPGTEDAAWAFFSPDGKWVGYFARDRLMKMPVEGGPSAALCQVPTTHVRGASWGSDGNIIAALASNSGLMRVPADGGIPVPVTELNEEKGELTHRWPQVLPGARAVVFTSSTNAGRYEEASIEAQSLETGRRKTLMRGGYYGRYLPSGHLVFARGTTLFAVAMDAERLELNGSPVAVLDDVVTDPQTGSMEFEFSRSGTALCRTGKWPPWPRSLAWVDHAGNVHPMAAAPQAFGDVRVSPDGRTLAVSIAAEGARWYIALYDWRHDRLKRLTFGNVDLTPQWFPDGSRVAFTSDRHGGPQNLYAVRADGGGEPERLAESRNIQIPFSFLSQPARLAFVELNPVTGADIWMLPLSSMTTGVAERPAPFLCTQAEEEAPAFSPDGRWIAYESNEAGEAHSEVYVRSWSRPEIKWQVSVAGGHRPVWSRAGGELYYQDDERRVMAVRCIAKRDALSWSKPVLRFSGRVVAGMNTMRNFDPGPDGRLAVILDAGGNTPAANQLTILLNFFDEIRRRTGR